MTIRPYAAADRDACLQIFKNNVPRYFDPSESEGLELWLNGLDEGVIKYKTSAADFFYVLEHDSSVIGCGGFYILKDRNYANMAWGMVLQKYHGQGFGKQLMLYRLKQIEQMYPTHAVTMDTSQHTYQFYEKLGFSVVKILEDGYAPGLHRYDMIKQ